jgi:hypothetical protein
MSFVGLNVIGYFSRGLLVIWDRISAFSSWLQEKEVSRLLQLK